jgi:iron(III) transport system substrate-binding protein
MTKPHSSLRATSLSPAPWALAVLATLLLGACAKEPDVVLYCALDQVFSEDLVRRFERESGLTVRAEFDVEAHKTVGLVNRIRAEGARPRCDVFWNNEIAHTVALADEGLLASYDSPSAADIPEAFRDPERRWTGFAARARVFIVNTDKADPAEITGMADMLDPRWKGQVAMARPRTGTTLTHAAALYTTLGEEGARKMLHGLIDAGVNFVQSNGQVMKLVRSGEFAWGLTDTDDFNVALEAGFPVAVVYPDQGEGQPGTMVIPNTVCILANAPHPEAARKLVDFILSPEVERELAFARGAQIPVRAGIEHPEHVHSTTDFRVMDVDFREVGRELPRRQAELEEMFVN